MDKPVKVILAREPETAEQEEYEPQRVRVISNNIGLMLVDGDYRTSGTPWDFFVKIDNLPKGIRRIALNYAQFFNTVPNVNIKNNTLRYFDNGDATFKIATLPVGFYTFTEIGPVLANALNASVPAPVAPFVVTPNVNFILLPLSFL